MVSATVLVVTEKGASFSVQNVELDELQPHELLVDLVATGICHTDLAVQHGKIPFGFPAILGHEGSGVIRAVGSAIRDFAKGDHVVLSYNFCGSCQSCQAKKPYRCDTALQQNFGGARKNGSQTVISKDNSIKTCFFGQSSFCNPAIVQETSCVKVDPKLPLEVVCALGCGFQTGAGSIYNVVKPAERGVQYLAIYGIGGVGCAAVMAAKHLSATSTSTLPKLSIIAIDINEDRLRLASKLGATHIINSRSQNVRDTIGVITNGRGLDAAVDCSAVVSVVEEMISLLGPGGIAVTIGGPPPERKVQINIFDMLIRCKTYCGCHQGNAYSKEFIPWLAKLYSEGHFPLETMQTSYLAKDINEACKDMADGKVLKPILLWQ